VNNGTYKLTVIFKDEYEKNQAQNTPVRINDFTLTWCNIHPQTPKRDSTPANKYCKICKTKQHYYYECSKYNKNKDRSLNNNANNQRKGGYQPTTMIITHQTTGPFVQTDQGTKDVIITIIEERNTSQIQKMKDNMTIDSIYSQIPLTIEKEPVINRSLIIINNIKVKDQIILNQTPIDTEEIMEITDPMITDTVNIQLQEQIKHRWKEDNLIKDENTIMEEIMDPQMDGAADIIDINLNKKEQSK
jgi:hypothetical protein